MWLTTAGFEKFVSKVCCKHKCEKAGYCKGKAATAWKSHLSAVTTQHFRAALYAPAVSAATMSAALVSAAPNSTMWACGPTRLTQGCRRVAARRWPQMREGRVLQGQGCYVSETDPAIDTQRLLTWVFFR